MARATAGALPGSVRITTSDPFVATAATSPETAAATAAGAPSPIS